MSDSPAPRISFVVATDTFATVTDVLASLAAQPDPEGIEVVLACPSAAGLGGSATAPAGPLRIVEVGDLVPIERAFAAGIRAASAPVVLIGETHAFPEPGALEPLIRAICDEGYAAVAPGLRNANPQTSASWASLMVTYGWTLGERREANALSTHNTAYRRELLLAFGDELPALLRLGGDVHDRLRRQGHRLLVEPASVFAHQNVVKLRSCIGDRFHAARSYSASRSESWSLARRALYAVSAPLIPLVIAARVVRSPGWRAHRSELPRSIFLPMAVSLAAHGAGELAAYAAGVGNSPERIIEYEIHRARHL
jgi:hypothetical protein